MAANEGQPNVSQRRRRAAVTIDLPASRIDPAPESDAAPAEGVPVSVVGEEPPKPEPPRAPPVPPSSPPRVATDDIGRPPPRGSNGFALFAFTVMGALVVLIGGYLLMFTDILPPPGRETSDATRAEIVRLEGEIADLRATVAANPAPDLAPLMARLAALEEATAGIGQMRAALDGLAAGVETGRTERAAIAADLANLAREVVAAAAAAGDPEAAARLGADIDTLTARIAALETAGPAAEVVALQQGLGRLEAEVAALAEATQALAVDAVERNRAADAARVLAYNNLRAAAERGEPFAAELAVLAELGVDAAALAPVEAAAAGGVPSRSALVEAFPAVADAILAAGAEPNPDAGFLERFVGNIQNVVTVRPNVPIEGDTPVAIVSRMQAAVAAGDFATALTERAALSEAVRAASAEWAAGVEARLALDEAIARLAAALQPNAE